MRLTLRRPLVSALVLATAVMASAAAPRAAHAAKKYQVTGTVVSVTEKLIVIQKPDDEKWEIERTADTKVDGTLKVGAKVTVYYHMVADSADVKEGGKKDTK